MKNYFSLIILISALFAQNVVTESDSLNPISLEGVEVFSSLRQVNEGDLAASAVIFNDELEVLQGQHFSDLLYRVPNLNYAGGTSRPRFFQIRSICLLIHVTDPSECSVWIIHGRIRNFLEHVSFPSSKPFGLWQGLQLDLVRFRH